MEQTIVRREGDDRVVCARCAVASSMLARMRGLLGRRSIDADEGLLIPTSAIHMWFMRFPIDAVFLDRERRVLRIASDLRPWRMATCRGAREVIELAAGAAARAELAVGDRLVLDGGGA